jgi:hypothetical protein
VPEVFGCLAVDGDEVLDVADILRLGECCLPCGQIEARQQSTDRRDSPSEATQDDLGDYVLANTEPATPLTI